MEAGVGEWLRTADSADRAGGRLLHVLLPLLVLLNPDCGFATFADNPVSSARTAESKLRAMVQAAAQLRAKYGIHRGL